MPRCGAAPAARTAQPGRSWRCGSNYSAGREVGEDRRGHRRAWSRAVWRLQHNRLGGPPCSDPAPRSRPLRSARRSPSWAAFCAAARTPGAPTPTPCRNRWRRPPDLPVTVDHAMAAGVAGRLYVVGGYAPGSVARNTAFAFHHGHWTPLPSMPAPRARDGAAIVGDKLYVVGGVEVGPAGPRRIRIRLRDGTLDHVPRAKASRAPRRGRARRPGLRRRRTDARARHQPGHRRGVRPAQRTVAGDSRVPGKRGGTAAAAVGGRLLSAGAKGRRNDPNRVRLLARDSTVDAAATDADVPPRSRPGRLAWPRVYALAGGPQPGLTVSGANECWRSAGDVAGRAYSGRSPVATTRRPSRS